MREYRNTGAPFETTDGRTVERGETCELSDQDARRRAYKLEPVGEAPEPEPENPLDGVDFGSEEARQRAEELDLSAGDFEGELGTGQGHAFLVDDVESLAGES